MIPLADDPDREGLAVTISVGDELLAGESSDTHGRTISEALGERGVRVVSHQVVVDDVVRIEEAIRTGLGRASLVLVTGGLGPTLDDVSREGLAAAIEEPLVEDESGITTIERWFAGRSRSMPETNRRQALRPRSATLLENGHGTAPGVLWKGEAGTVVLLPGPPRELRPMLASVIETLLGDADSRPRIVVNAHGIGESDAASRIEELMRRDQDLPVATTVSNSIVSARIRGRSVSDQDLIHSLAATIESAWAPYAFGRDQDSLAEVVGRELVARSLTLATAESCTGGGLGEAITAVSGSSAWYPGGVVTYSNERKRIDLGVSPDSLQSEGAVSGDVVAQMVSGIRSRTGADIGVATSGIAGPGGGSDSKPVGTVWIGVGDSRGTDIRHLRFPGGRDLVRSRTVLTALQMIRFRLLGERAPLLWERGSQENQP